MNQIEVNVVFKTEGDHVVAQGIEYDIAAQGRDIASALAAFGRTLAGQISLDVENGREPMEGIGPAPIDQTQTAQVVQNLDASMFARLAGKRGERIAELEKEVENLKQEIGKLREELKHRPERGLNMFGY